MRLKKFIWVLVAAAAVVAGCAIEPPLHLRKAANARIYITTKVEVSLMWQTDWNTRWQFNWNESMLGPLGYALPASMRMHIFTHGPNGQPIAHTVHNFVGDNAQMEVFIGTHDLLFHNNDSEALLFSQDDDLAPVNSYTRNISSGLKASSPVFTPAQKAAGFTTKADPDEEPVSLMPEGLFSLFDANRVITDNPDDYVYENGKYVLKIQGELYPSTYIYLVQVKLLNNDSRVVGSSGGAALTGMAGGVNLNTRESWTSTVSVPMDIYMDKEQDMLGGKVFTFGNPGCNPYDDASVAAMPEQNHFLVLNVTYVNGSWKNIRMDVTDQVRALPQGGVITLEIDVNDFPPDESAGGGGGFNALIGGWDEETGSTTIIN